MGGCGRMIYSPPVKRHVAVSIENNLHVNENNRNMNNLRQINPTTAPTRSLYQHPQYSRPTMFSTRIATWAARTPLKWMQQSLRALRWILKLQCSIHRRRCLANFLLNLIQLRRQWRLPLHRPHRHQRRLAVRLIKCHLTSLSTGFGVGICFIPTLAATIICCIQTAMEASRGQICHRPEAVQKQK